MHLRVATVIIFSFQPWVVLAQQIPAVTETVVVTASAEPEPLDEAAAAVSVVDGALLKSAGVTSVVDALRCLPGVTVARTGLDNGTTSLFVRGNNSTHTLVLLDGVRLNSPFFGGYDWSVPMTLGVGRVEVARGPYSALYGGDAVGGVVQLFSETGSGTSARAFLEGGSDQWLRGEAEATVAGNGWRLLIAGSDRSGSGTLANDDFSSRAGTMSFQWDLGRDGRIGVLARGTRARTEVPFTGATATPHRFTATTEKLAAVPIRLRLGPTTVLEASVSHVSRDLVYRDSEDAFGYTASDTEAVSTGVRVAVRQDLGHHRLTVGAEGRRDQVTDGSAFGINLQGKRLETSALFVQDRVALGKTLSLLGGVRWDHASPWGDEVSPRATLSWNGGSARAWYSHGRAFRAPGLGELYYPYSGNPALESEHSRANELGVAVPLTTGHGELQLVAFSNRVSGLIDFDYARFRFENIAQAAQDGVELAWVSSLAGASWLQVALTWLDARDGKDQPLLRRPEWSGSVTLRGLSLGLLSGEVSLVCIGARQDIDPVSYARVDQPGFVTASISATAAITQALSARLRVENVADRRYQEVRGYPSPGRRFMVGIETVLR